MRIGIDIGGSHIGVGLVDEKGNIILKKEKDLLKENKQNIKEELICTITKYIKHILKEQNINVNQIEFIGISYPGSLRNGKIGLSVKLGSKGYEIQEELAKNFKIPVYIKNDAKCAAICEKEFGSLFSYSNCIFLTIGTGIGGALFINQKLLTIHENDTFKVGHTTIKKDGIECKCGRRGCFENYASIKALKKSVTEEYNIKEEMTGIELHKFIINNSKTKKMQKIIDEYIENLSIGISNLINLFEPEAISIGGSFAYYEDILFNKLKEKLQENTNKVNDSYPDLLLATAKNDAGIIGATRIN